jgi:hypothetical protein
LEEKVVECLNGAAGVAMANVLDSLDKGQYFKRQWIVRILDALASLQ